MDLLIIIGTSLKVAPVSDTICESPEHGRAAYGENSLHPRQPTSRTPCHRFS